MSEHEARNIYIPAHFVQRFRERIQSSADPVLVGQGLIWAIANHKRELYQFMGRERMADRRRYRAVTADGHPFIAIVDTNSMVPVTVFEAEDD